MLPSVLQIASHITNPITASVFVAAFLGVALYVVVKSKNKQIAWQIAVGLVVVGITPLFAQTILAWRGIYHVTVLVLDSDNQPVVGAEVTTSRGEIKKTGNGWEIDIPPQIRPADGKLTIYAKLPNAFLAGSSTVTLERDYYPSLEIKLSKLVPVTIHGQVLDENQKAIAGADVTLPECSKSTTTDLHGMFVLESCVADGQLVRIHAEKGKSAETITVPARDSVELVLRRD